MADKTDKGGEFEEALRDYFLFYRYFAVRGVPVMFGDEDITDIDIWLYLRPSPVTRVRLNVDAKNRTKSHALERVVWAKGLQHVLGFDACIVATTDTRQVTKQYGHKHDVLVLDGTFTAWVKAKATPSERLSDEDLDALLGPTKDDKLTGHWRGRIKRAKSRLATQLGFDACNAWLADIQYFVEQSAAPGREEAAVRIVYMLVAYFLIGIDYALRTIAFDESELRRKTLNEGFRYGARGERLVTEALNTAVGLVDSFDPALSARVRSHALQNFELIGAAAEPLAEFFSRGDNGDALFAWARGFEAKTYAKTFTSPGALETSLQSALGVLLDFFKIDRRAFLK